MTRKNGTNGNRRKPLKRNVPIAKKAVRRGKPKRPSCAFRSCQGRVWVLDLCRKHARAEADRLFSLFVRRRDGKCVACGKTRELQCSHHVTRSRIYTRWDSANAVTHCAGCHVTFTANPALHHEWILGYVGFEGWDDLMDKAYGPIDDATGRRTPPPPWTAQDMEAVLVLLRYGQKEAA